MKGFTLSLCAALLLAALPAGNAAFAAIPAEVTLGTPRMGEIRFDHKLHQKVGQCAVCHHKGVERGGCRDCHGVDTAIPNMKEASHAMCRHCHKKMGAPFGCKDCHIKK